MKAILMRIDMLNKALGLPLKAWEPRPDGSGSYNTGAFYIDHCSGGLRIEQKGHAPFGHQRMTKRELLNQLEAILVAIKLARGEKHGGAWPLESSEVPDYKTALSELVTTCKKHRWHVNADEPDTVSFAAQLLNGAR